MQIYQSCQRELIRTDIGEKGRTLMWSKLVVDLKAS